MELNFEQIKSITFGAMEVTQEADGFHFHRFNAAQRAYYKATSEADFYRKSFATSGIKLQFHTDSKSLALDVDITGASSRSYYAVDVFVNGQRIGSMDNLYDTMPEDYAEMTIPMGDTKKTFPLGEGMKKVCIYLPWSACAVIKTMELDDGAHVEAVKPSKKLLAYGDSITQGYDAQHPSNKYITKLAEALDAQEFNRAIGGEEFVPQLAREETLEDPDYITVAYGTNDWSHSTRESLIQRCTDMYAILSSKYPKAQIYAMTPIWRADWDQNKPVGPFHDVEVIIREAVKDLPNVKVIRCYDVMPENTHLCADLRLHPNDAGFAYYFESLWNKIKGE